MELTTLIVTVIASLGGSLWIFGRERSKEYQNALTVLNATLILPLIFKANVCREIGRAMSFGVVVAMVAELSAQHWHKLPF